MIRRMFAAGVALAALQIGPSVALVRGQGTCGPYRREIGVEPPHFAAPLQAYDEQRQTMVLLGTRVVTGELRLELWEFVDGSWFQRVLGAEFRSASMGRR
jgi:hypothetical protein